MKEKFIIGIKSNRLITCSEDERKKGWYQNRNTFDIEIERDECSLLKTFPLL